MAVPAILNWNRLQSAYFDNEGNPQNTEADENKVITYNKIMNVAIGGELIVKTGKLIIEVAGKLNFGGEPVMKPVVVELEEQQEP